MRILTASSLIAALLISGCQTPESASLSKNQTDDLSVASVDPANADDLTDFDNLGEAGSTTGIQVAAADDTTTPRSISNEVKEYTAPPKGTVFTWRNNWASLPPVISLKFIGTEKLGKNSYAKFTSMGGLKKGTTAYYNVEDFSLKGYRDAKNKALVSYHPVEQRYRFPMKPGDKWVTAWKSKDHKENKITSGGGVVTVIGFENLKLKAGNYRAIKLKMPLQRDAPKGMKHHVWFSPELGVTVKEQIGSGTMIWTQELEKVQKSG